MNLPCSGSLELIRSCMCCVLRVESAKCRELLPQQCYSISLQSRSLSVSLVTHAWASQSGPDIHTTLPPLSFKLLTQLNSAVQLTSPICLLPALSSRVSPDAPTSSLSLTCIKSVLSAGAPLSRPLILDPDRCSLFPRYCPQSC